MTTIENPFGSHNVKDYTISDEFDNGVKRNSYTYYQEDGSKYEGILDNTQMLLNGDFEGSEEVWKSRENATVEILSEENGNHYMYISNRQSTGATGYQDISGKVKSGDTVQFSARVKFDTTIFKDMTFHITLRNGVDYGQTGYFSKNMKTVIVTPDQKGKWFTINGSFTVPENTVDDTMGVFVETNWQQNLDADDTIDFCVDDFTMSQKIPVERAYYGSNLDLAWQWNHNPNNRYWSLKEREGYLRLKTFEKVNCIFDAKNTITQRSFAPYSSGKTLMDTSSMRDGDVAGLWSYQCRYGYVGIMKEDGKKYIVMVKNEGGDKLDSENAVIKEKIELSQDMVYLKLDYDYSQMKNKAFKASFQYSLDGKTWNNIGTSISLYYDLSVFTGYRFCLFNYSTKEIGGYVDFDYFRVSNDFDNSNSKAEINELTSDVGTVRKSDNRYEISVPYGTKAVNFSAELADLTGMLYVDGEKVNADETFTIMLEKQEEIKKVVVYGADHETTKDYEICIVTEKDAQVTSSPMPSVAPLASAVPTRTPNKNRSDTRDAGNVEVKEKAVVKINALKYKVTKAASGKKKGTVAVTGAVNKKLKRVTIPSSITYKGKKYAVTAVNKKAFSKCKKLKFITIRSKMLRVIGKNAFKGVNKRAVIRVPSSKLKMYKKLMKGKGITKIMRIKN